MPRLTPEQKAARRLGIGASEVAEVLGISPYEDASPVRLFAEKAGIIGNDDDEEESIEQKVGHALESALVKLYQDESGFEVLTFGEFVESVVHPEFPWARCNLDGRPKGKRAALEVKVVGIGMAGDWDLDSDDGIPHYVRVQCCWQMFCADLDEVHVIALIGGTAFRVFYVMRDRELEAIVVAAVRSFWAFVLARKAPPLDASKGCKQYLEALYPSIAAKVELKLDDTDEAHKALDDMLTDRIRLADIEKKAGEAKEIRNNQIREAIGKLGATHVWSHTAKASWKADKNGLRTLLVKAAGAAKTPKIIAPKANAANPPVVVDDGSLF